MKGVASFQYLTEHKEAIAQNAWHYVMNSWYNHWTSYLIESIFKSHKRVVSAIGAIKSVDFFIDDIPLDLKVTYFPNLYLDKKFREYTGLSELAWLKRKAKEWNVKFPLQLDNSALEYYILENLEEKEATDVLNELSCIKNEILDSTIKQPELLLHWLYTNQGEMRFGAENRLFLILVNRKNFAQLWKLKRAFELLTPRIDSYLTTFADSQLIPISFTHNGTTYTPLADVIFITK